MKFETKFDIGDVVINLDEVKNGEKNPVHYTVVGFELRDAFVSGESIDFICHCVCDDRRGIDQFFDCDLISLEQYENLKGIADED